MLGHDASRSTVGDASVASRARRIKADAAKRAQQLGDPHTGKDQQVVVKDPDDSSIDRTPHPLQEKPAEGKPAAAAPSRPRPAAGGSTAATASATDRRMSTATSGEGGSVSRHSHSEERSQASQMESSSSSTGDQPSSWTPEDESSSNAVESSDSHSVSDRSSSQMRRQSTASVSTDHAYNDSSSGGRRGGAEDRGGAAGGRGAAAADAAAAAAQASRPKEWSAEEIRQWRQQEVVVTLTETPVLHLFSHHDAIVALEDAKEATAVRKRNERYEQFCSSRKGGEAGGRYAERGVATLTVPGFAVVTELPLRETADRGSHVTTWKLYDEQQRSRLGEDDEEGGFGATKAGGTDAAAATSSDAAAGADDAGGQGGSAADGGGGGDAGGAASNDDEGGDGGDDGGDRGGDRGGAGGGAKRASSSSAKWLSSPSLLLTVMAVERCVVMNNFEDLQLAYRGLAMEALKDVLLPDEEVGSGRQQGSPTGLGGRDERSRRREAARERDGAGWGATEAANPEPAEREAKAEASEIAASAAAAASSSSSSAAKAKMRVLWRYGSEMTKDYSVTSLAWNHRNQDILAVGYSDAGNGAGSTGHGLVACWSLKNPVAPERVIRIDSESGGISALHFSAQRPSLLAVGSRDGTLAIYDVRKHGHQPILRSTVNTGQHTGTVWEVRWVRMDENRDEALMTISADGRCTEWSIKKNALERTTDLMHLKRVPNRVHDAAVALAAGAVQAKGVVKEAMLSRQSGGMCFDVNPKDAMTYVVGTEDGTLHKCSKSTNESYVLDYNPPHSEPVYRVRWSRFRPDFFLTCSADWTSRLYHTDGPHYLLRFENQRQDAVQDLCWSPAQANIFATCTAQGHIDVWDLADPLQPKVSLPLEDRSLNCLLFADHDGMILGAGDNRGDVAITKLFGHEFERDGTDEQQADRFMDLIRRNVAADMIPATAL